MSDPTEEEAVEAIKSMGIIQDEEQIREALRRCDNNPQEAFHLLIPESPRDSNLLGNYSSQSSYERTDSYDADVDMRDTETHPGSGGGDSDRDSTTVSYSLDEDNLKDVEEEVENLGYKGGEREEDVELQEYPPRPEVPPPRYEDIVDENQELLPPSSPSPPPPPPPGRLHEDGEDKQVTPTPSEHITASAVPKQPHGSIEFPLTHFYELESRVHTEQWSIPYKRDESLAICMVSTVKMIREGPGVAEADEHCKKFMTKTMPDSFQKLVTHEAVFRWDVSIMEGILDMCRILMELIAERLKQKPIPLHSLNLLNMVLNSDANYHTKMRNKRTDPSRWQRVLGEGKIFAVMPHFHTHKDPKGWLVEIMNVFAQHGGVQAIKDVILNTEELSLKELTALFQPFSACEDYINPPYMKAELSKCILRAMRFVHDLSEEQLKEKEVGCVSDLLKSLKSLLVRCSLWDMVGTVDTLRLETTIRMLNIAHFNAKMNALKEVVRLTDEPYQAATRGVKSPISADKITDWLVSNKVLSIALGGNLHQSQYCDKLKSIVEFLGTKLSLDELSTIWEMQVDKNPVQVENVHGILAAAACKFTPQHLDHLFQLIQQSWESASDRYREKLLELIGKIGKDDRQGKTATKILELLWNLAHLPQLSREMVELALEAHSSILVESFHTKEAEKRTYISKCVEDIRKGQWVASAFRHLHRLAKGFFRTGYGHKDQHQIAELQRQYDLLRLTCSSLFKCHSKAAADCKQNNEPLTGATMVEDKYTHEECVDIHLKFMAFLLQDGALYMPTKRAHEIWDALIANPNSCDADRRLAFKWFDHSMGDMEHDTQVYMFNSRVLKVDPSKLDLAGYHCLRNFFETINLVERKLKKITASYHSLIVENPDLTGIDYLWRAALEVTDTKIADELISNILQVSYQGLSPKLKKDVSALHQRFIDEVFHRLDGLMEPAPGASKTGSGSRKAIDMGVRLQAIERLLLLAQQYITVVEENHHFQRYMPPHGASFLGHPITLSISPDQPKPEFKLECHSNESILSVRQKIGKRLNVSAEQVQMGISDRWLDSSDNNKLINQMDFAEQHIIVRTHSVSTSYNKGSESGAATAQRQSLAQELERTLPGVIMASRKEVFDKMEELCELGDPRVIMAVRNLLMLIPTDHRVADALEVFSHQAAGGASEDPQSPPSPQVVLKEYLDTSSSSPTQLLYNLEVLSSCLIPTQQDRDETDTHLFRRTFLEAGGLKSVINVLQRNALPSDVDLTIRQDCYAIALTLARFLLCNQAMLMPAPRLPFRQHSTISQSSQGAAEGEGEEPLTVGGGGGVAGVSGEGGVSVAGAEEGGERQTLAKVMSTEEEFARLTIETMSVDDFATTLAYLVRVCWSAAAGQLHLASIGDSAPPSPAQSLRGKSPATSSLQLKAGICAQQANGSVSAKDAAIARESLELLVTCLKLRSSLLNIFYTLPCVEDFVIDILLGSPHADIRASAVDQFFQLCQTIDHESPRPPVSETSPVKRARTSPAETPRHFFLHLLVKHPMALWEKGRRSREEAGGEREEVWQWERCSEYFSFRCKLLENLRDFEQESLSVDILQMLHDEVDWLKNVVVPPSPCPDFQSLLAGHLRLCQALLTCQGINKEEFGRELVQQLVSEYLFPASRMILESYEPEAAGIVSVNPICSEVNTRVAAYDLLVELACGCLANLDLVAKQLIRMHHMETPQMAKEWEFQPPVVGRTMCGFVGLKNAGATCYMNSVLQQLYMTHPIREVILSAESDTEDQSILPELQCAFGHLLESKLQYYSPEDFWKKFKLWGQPVNVREQQDAFDFFCNLTDQVDEQLKKTSYDPVFKETFGGAFLDQKICRGCDHTFEQEESFLSLSLPVKSKTLEESLKEFVKGDWLEGDNAYFCEKCQEKRDTLKRMCIKSLPPVLVVQLKRFGYDWEANRAIKFDDYFEFPWVLDMEPYTAEGLSQREKGGGPVAQQLYDLVGIVVHSGQASAGHYYTFIREKRPSPPSTSVPSTIPEEGPLETPSSSLGRWLRFNDILVDEFTMGDAALEAECFGGSYKAKSTDVHSTNPETRIRYWNAYMLFYEAVNRPQKSTSTRKLSASEAASPLSPQPEDDKLSQLQALVQKGERRHMFLDAMPAKIQRSVNEENLQFMQHRDVYCLEYFEFVRALACVNHTVSLDQSHPLQSKFGITSLQLAINFLFHTYFRTRKKLRSDLDHWVHNVRQLLHHCREACQWLVELLGSPVGSGYLKPFLLECTTKEVRMSFCQIASSAVQSYIGFGGSTEEGPVVHIIDTLLQMLEKDAVDNSKSCAEYFEFFKTYASYPQGCRHLLEKDVFVLLLNFLLGPTPKTTEARQDKHPPRRWSSNQVKEFGPLHGTLSLLVRNTDISIFESETDAGEDPQVNPYTIPSNPADLQSPSDGMHQALFTIEHSKRFIRECVLTLRESDPVATEAIASTCCYCCWNNQSFSACTIEDLQIQISTLPSIELKAYFKVLTEILLISDSLQSKRISFTISGGKYQPHISIFNTIQNNSSMQSDSKKAYQGIKFLVGLANKCKVVRDFLLSHPTEWQWAVVWLRRKMSDYYTWPQGSSVSNESSGTRMFQRTVSAQDTLEEANALLNELEARDARQAPQVTGSSSSDKTQTYENSSMESNTNQSSLDRIEG